MTLRILVRGGGDLASGVAVRLHRSGWQVLITELPQPKAVRRMVSFAQAIYDEQVNVEEVVGRRVGALAEIEPALLEGVVPVIIDPEAAAATIFCPHVIVDCRMLKRKIKVSNASAILTIGIGPGFTAGIDCDAVIETNRGPSLGRVIWSGNAQDDTGVPERVGDHQTDRVLRAPIQGAVESVIDIGTKLAVGDTIAYVSGQPVTSPIAGVLRGLIQKGVFVSAGEKIGDIDPRGDPRWCGLVSDKALSIGGGVLEAILSCKQLRSLLYAIEA